MTERTAQAKRCVRAKEKRKSGETDKPGDERICIWSVVVEKTREKKFSAASVGAKRVPDTFYRCQLCLLHFPLSYGINRTERIDASLPMEPNLANTCTPFSLRALLRRNSPMLATSRCFLRVTTQRNATVFHREFFALAKRISRIAFQAFPSNSKHAAVHPSSDQTISG